MTSKHTPFTRCAHCGANLDPGERCDCERREAEARKPNRARTARKAHAQNVRAYERGMKEWLQC